MVEAGTKGTARDDRSLRIAVAVSIALHLFVLFFGRIALAPPADASELRVEYPEEVAFLLEEDVAEFVSALEVEAVSPAGADGVPTPDERPTSQRQPVATDLPTEMAPPSPSVAPMLREEPASATAEPQAIVQPKPDEPVRRTEPAAVMASPIEARPRPFYDAPAFFAATPSPRTSTSATGATPPEASGLPNTSGVPRSTAITPGSSAASGGTSPTNATGADRGGVNAASGDGGTSNLLSGSLRDVYLNYRARIGTIISSAIQRRFRREAVRRDEGTVTFQLEIRAGGLRRITQISSESPLLERLTRQAIEEAILPSAPTGLPDPLAFRFRSRFALEG